MNTLNTKCHIRRMVLLATLAVMTFVGGYAQEPAKVGAVVDGLVQKYGDVKGVDCMTLVKGKGLEMVKMMFNKQFGKEFMRGVTSITIIEYSEAPQETAQALRKETDAFASLLEEFNLKEDSEFAGNGYIRSFASVSSDTGTLSDFIIAVEKDELKMIMHMAGVIKIEQ